MPILFKHIDENKITKFELLVIVFIATFVDKFKPVWLSLVVTAILVAIFIYVEEWFYQNAK